MSEFTFPCPLCQQDIVCDTQYHGQQLQCPICQNEITAPEAEAKPAGSLAIKTPTGPKHAPTVPMLQKRVVLKKKSSMGKMLAVTGGVIAVVAALFFGARYTGLKSYLPAFLGGGDSAATEAAAAGTATGESAPPAETADAAPEAPPPPPAPIVWMTNLANAIIPTNAVHGNIATNEFKYETARVDNGVLALRQGKDVSPDIEVGVFFGLRPGESLSGKTIEISPEARVGPRIWKKWKVAGKLAPLQKVYSKGYALKLAFGEVSEDKVPGKIYLCFPDEDQSVVAGSFVASVGTTSFVQPAVQTTAPTAPQMSEQMRSRYGVRPPGRP